MFEYDELLSGVDKTLSVYREKKMIEIKKSYVLELTEEQARQLYNLLQSAKERLSYGEQYNELRPLCNELKKLFDSGVR